VCHQQQLGNSGGNSNSYGDSSSNGSAITAATAAAAATRGEGTLEGARYAHKRACMIRTGGLEYTSVLSVLHCITAFINNIFVLCPIAQ